jgi:uncharacterized protein
MAQSQAADRVVTVAPQSGQAVSAGRGELVRVVDVEGHQVGDMWAIDAADRGRWLSASHTRDRCERLFLAVGVSSARPSGHSGVAICCVSLD